MGPYPRLTVPYLPASHFHQELEIRADLRFAALDKLRSYYTIRVEKDNEEKPLKLKANGDVIKDLAFPKKDK